MRKKQHLGALLVTALMLSTSASARITPYFPHTQDDLLELGRHPAFQDVVQFSSTENCHAVKIHQEVYQAIYFTPAHCLPYFRGPFYDGPTLSAYFQHPLYEALPQYDFAAFAVPQANASTLIDQEWAIYDANQKARDDGFIHVEFTHEEPPQLEAFFVKPTYLEKGFTIRQAFSERNADDAMFKATVSDDITGSLSEGLLMGHPSQGSLQVAGIVSAHRRTGYDQWKLIPQEFTNIVKVIFQALSSNTRNYDLTDQAQILFQEMHHLTPEDFDFFTTGLQTTPRAKFYLGLREYRAHGFFSFGNRTKAIELYRDGCEYDIASACYELALIFDTKEEGGDLGKALDFYFQAAYAGHADAQYAAAQMIEEREGSLVGVGSFYGAYWYEEAAKQQHLYALLKTAEMYSQGKGREKNFSVAQDMYFRAAIQGHVPAMLISGGLYQTGEWGNQNFEKARYFFEILDKKGYMEASNDLGKMYYIGQGVAKDYVKAHQLLEKSALNGVDNSLTLLGWMYATGEGCDVDYEKAIYWLEKAVQQNDAFAMALLGSLYIETQKGHILGWRWIEKAARLGSERAQELLNQRARGEL